MDENENANGNEADEENKIAIRIKYKDLSDILFVSVSKLNINDFILAAFQKLGISTSVLTKVHLRDNQNVPLNHENFAMVVKTFWRCAAFFVQLEYAPLLDKVVSAVVSSVSIMHM